MRSGSANKLGIIFSSDSIVSIKDGIGKIWAESSDWSGEGLQITARRRASDSGGVFLFGSSKSIVVLPAE